MPIAQPTISVIIPAYNYAQYLPIAIRSVLAQTFQDFEIIIVDDGSTDDTHSVVSEFVDPRIDYIYQENQGLAAARNTGIRSSHGLYIALLDADDAFYPAKLELQLRELSENPDISIIFTGWDFVLQSGKLIRHARPWEDNLNLDLESLLTNPQFSSSTALIRRDVFDRVGYFDRYLYRSEDFDFFIRAAANGCKMRWVKMVLCTYCIHQANMTKNDYHLNDPVDVLDRFFQLHKEMDDSLTREAYSRVYLKNASIYYQVGLVEEAKKSIDKAIECKPELMYGDIPKIVEIIRYWILDPRIFDKTVYMSKVINNLPGNCSGVYELRKKIYSFVYMDMAFSAYADREQTKTIQCVLRGVANDPRWLKNWGVWSIFIKSILKVN